MRIVLLPANDVTYKAYADAFRRRKVRPPERQATAVYVGVVDPERGGTSHFVCGASLYPAGQYTVIEHLVTNPEAPPKLAHACVVRAAQAATVWCSIEGTVPIVMAQSKGICRALRAAGYHSPHAKGSGLEGVWTALPMNDLGPIPDYVLSVRYGGHYGPYIREDDVDPGEVRKASPKASSRRPR